LITVNCAKAHCEGHSPAGPSYLGRSFHLFGAVISACAKLPMVDAVDLVFSQVTAPPHQLEGVGAGGALNTA